MTFALEKIPTVKSERWKYTNLSRALKNMVLTPASLGWDDNVSLLNPHAPGAGQYGDTHLWNLNAQSKDIKFISSDQTLHVVGRDGALLSPRIVIDVKDGQNVTIIEHQDGAGSYWKNMVVQITVGKNSTLRHYRIMEEGVKGVLTAFTHVKIADGGKYDAFNFMAGAGFIRNQIHAEIYGVNGHCGLAGINLLSGEQLGDTTITIEHQAPHGTSNQTYKSVLTDKSRGVFQGKVHVHQCAQKTDGYQLSNALILSPQAEMDTKPELEIYADDVKCSHGATTGMLDDDSLFYLRARGIPEKAARAMLIEAFCGQAIEQISSEEFAQNIRGKVHEWLTFKA